MKYLLYLFGFLPSIIWLLFYLRKDKHPESNKMVLKIFIFGMISGFVAICLERAFQQGQSVLSASFAASSIIAIFFGGALIEEIVKYGSVKIGTYKNPELDEPLDFILYMIISALGFAALENILVLSSYHPILTSAKAFQILSLRFVSATLLHALASGAFGYFLALSFFRQSRRKTYFLIGLGISVILHGIYNWSIMKIEGMNKFIIPLMILVGLGLFVSFGFRKLKKLKSVCIIKPCASKTK